VRADETPLKEEEHKNTAHTSIKHQVFIVVKDWD